LRSRHVTLISLGIIASVVVGVAALLLLADSGNGDGSSSAAASRTTTSPASTQTTALPSTTTTKPGAPPVVALVSEMSGATDAQLPAGWLRCTNRVAGFSVGAPADWYTSSDGPFLASPGFDAACSFFDPERFQVIPDVTDEAIQLGFPLGEARPAQPFETAIARYGSPCCAVDQRRDVQVAGRRAVYLAFTQLQGVNPSGHWACYVIDHDGSAFSVCTVDPPEGSKLTFDQRRVFLDQFVATLRFQ
jgi:hypothetical protein